MSENVIAIVDGTGDWGNTSYTGGMANSFCVQMALGFGLRVSSELDQGARASYERGPSLDGLNFHAKAQRAAEFLRAQKRKNPGTQLFLAGYSRGGSIVINAAERLLQSDPSLKIRGMFLFDPVARHPYEGGEVIPGNVQDVWRVQRVLPDEVLRYYDQKFDSVMKSLLKSVPTLPGRADRIRQLSNHIATDWLHPMRPGFKSTGQRFLGNSAGYHNKYCIGSHGALGGVGWADVDEDKQCQLDVATFMNGAIRALQLSFELKSHEPSAKYAESSFQKFVRSFF